MTTDEDMDARIRAAAGRGQIDPRDLDEPPGEATPAQAVETPVSDPAFGASGRWVDLSPGPDPESLFRGALTDAADRATRSSRMR